MAKRKKSKGKMSFKKLLRLVPAFIVGYIVGKRGG